MAEIISVTNATQLYAALSSATGGERIELAGGNYGKLSLSGYKFASDVTIVSADTNNPAVFDDLYINNSSHIAVDGVVIDYTYVDGQSIGYIYAEIIGSSNITVANSIFDGDLATTSAGDFGTGKALTIRDSSGIVIESNEIFNFWKGITFYNDKDIVIRGNDIHDMRSDGINFVTVDGVLIERNWFHDFQLTPTGWDHRDMIQWWSLNSSEYIRNVTITENFFDAGDGAHTQSIFARNVPAEQGGGLSTYWENITITDNVIYNSHVNGIVVGATDGLNVSNNTVLYDPIFQSNPEEVATIAPQIRLVDASINVTVENNITFKQIITNSSWAVHNNLQIGLNDYGTLFVNANTSDPTLDDLQAVDGGLIDKLGTGSELTRNYSWFGFGPGTGTNWNSGGTDTTTTTTTTTTTDPSPLPEPIPTGDSGPSDGVIDVKDLKIEIWDANTDLPIATIEDGVTIDSALLADGNTTIVITAVAGGDLDGKIGTVRLSVDDLYSRTERASPFTLFGDNKGDAAGGLVLSDGDHTLHVEVFSGNSVKTSALGDFTLNFGVGDAPAPATSSPAAPDTGNGSIGLEDLLVELWDADTDTAVTSLGTGVKLDLDLDILATGSATIAVTAVAGGDLDGKIGSVRLSLDSDYQHLENSSPYTLFGDMNGDASGGLALDAGQHALHIEVFSGANGSGTSLGDFTIDIEALAANGVLDIDYSDSLLLV